MAWSGLGWWRAGIAPRSGGRPAGVAAIGQLNLPGEAARPWQGRCLASQLVTHRPRPVSCRIAPHRTAEHRVASHRTAKQRSVAHRVVPHRTYTASCRIALPSTAHEPRRVTPQRVPFHIALRIVTSWLSYRDVAIGSASIKEPSLSPMLHRHRTTAITIDTAQRHQCRHHRDPSDPHALPVDLAPRAP